MRARRRPTSSRSNYYPHSERTLTRPTARSATCPPLRARGAGRRARRRYCARLPSVSAAARARRGARRCDRGRARALARAARRRTSARCARRGSMCARSAPGPRSGWSTGTRCSRRRRGRRRRRLHVRGRAGRSASDRGGRGRRALARDRALAPNGVLGWWEREDRFLALDELLARAVNGVPEGDHVVRARTGAT